VKRAALVALLALASSLARAQSIDLESAKRAIRIADLELAKAVATVTGNYVSIWREQPDGRWKVVLDIGTPGTAKPMRP
jgi:hypothetical protein